MVLIIGVKLIFVNIILNQLFKSVILYKTTDFILAVFNSVKYYFFIEPFRSPVGRQIIKVVAIPVFYLYQE